MDESITITDLPGPKYLNRHHWTNDEKIFQRKQTILEEIEDLHIPLRSGLLYKIKNSFFGPFFKCFNEKQMQDESLNLDKLAILTWMMQKYSDHDKNILENRNSFTWGTFNLLKEAVDSCGEIDWQYLAKTMEILKVDCCFVKRLDDTLQCFEKLKVLSISSNFIRTVPGKYFPRNLVYLNLFDNCISNVEGLIKHGPKTLKHLGLARNRLNDTSE